ncbi:MAG: NAD-dependent protein deacylase [Bacteroidales bacterium]|jgi:NAD-dependent deacetylase|nr:NAD-dependent protein deacylase [Bacteroidales bacterium]
MLLFLIRESYYTAAFTGAGISIESGIPPFRGEGGLWNTYDPNILDLSTYLQTPQKAWPAIKTLFYDFFGKAKPNLAHYKLAELEQKGLLKEVITQNIDNLHQMAGSNVVHEFHGRLNYFVCTKCNRFYKVSDINIGNQAPLCLESDCRSILKPDFIFFGEGIPNDAYQASLKAASQAKVFILIGTSGEIMPAASIPILAKQNGCKIIEINSSFSSFTNSITDVFIQANASDGLSRIVAKLEEFE